jgi:hypothetical protein
MKHIIATRKWEERDEALLRRWQGKWKEHKVELLAAAKERAKPKPVHIGGYASNQLALQASLGAVHALHDLQSPISKTLRMIAENSKWMKHVMNIHNQVREFQKLQGQASSFTHQFWEQEKMIRTASACLTGSLK